MLGHGCPSPCASHLRRRRQGGNQHAVPVATTFFESLVGYPDDEHPVKLSPITSSWSSNVPDTRAIPAIASTPAQDALCRPQLRQPALVEGHSVGGSDSARHLDAERERRRPQRLRPRRFGHIRTTGSSPESRRLGESTGAYSVVSCRSRRQAPFCRGGMRNALFAPLDDQERLQAFAGQVRASAAALAGSLDRRSGGRRVSGAEGASSIRAVGEWDQGSSEFLLDPNCGRNRHRGLLRFSPSKVAVKHWTQRTLPLPGWANGRPTRRAPRGRACRNRPVGMDWDRSSTGDSSSSAGCSSGRTEPSLAMQSFHDIGWYRCGAYG